MIPNSISKELEFRLLEECRRRASVLVSELQGDCHPSKVGEFMRDLVMALHEIEKFREGKIK